MDRTVLLGRYEDHDLYALALGSFGDWPTDLAVPGCERFVLFVAANARSVGDTSVMEAARRSLASGLCYLVAWGPDCERVHDLFDRVIVDEHFRGTETVESVIMTTWHERDSLEDALAFFLGAATPADDYRATCRSWLAVSIGSDDWAARIASALTHPATVLSSRDAQDDGA
ncbi:MAG: hypothetical protein KIT58_11745 [Planctomycetota bacterium]|nr:hypothetical protein [Planctomycetota bacterium]